MDIGTFRGIVTAVLLGLFVWLVVWAYSKARCASFNDAAQLPLEEDGHES